MEEIPHVFASLEISSVQSLEHCRNVCEELKYEKKECSVNLELIQSHWANVRWAHDVDCSFCNICKGKFTVTNRRTHCRSCGNIFCKLHCNNFCRLPAFGYFSKVKACDLCIGNESSMIRKRLLAGNCNDDISLLPKEIVLDHGQKRIGRYSIVFKGTARFNNSILQVAVKLFHPWLRDNPAIIEQEQITLQRLTAIPYSYIINSIDIGSICANNEFLITPWYELGTLREYLTSSVRAMGVPFSTRCVIIQQVAAAISYLHSALELLHNDLCADNVLVATDIMSVVHSTAAPPLIKLFDLASSRPIANNQTALVNAEWQLRPRPTHRAPEVFDDENSSKHSSDMGNNELPRRVTGTSCCSTASDVYSLSVLACEVLGHCSAKIFDQYPPLLADVRVAVVERGLRPRVLCMPHCVSDTSEVHEELKPLELLIARGMVKNHTQRPPISEYSTILESIISSLPS